MIQDMPAPIIASHDRAKSDTSTPDTTPVETYPCNAKVESSPGPSLHMSLPHIAVPVPMFAHQLFQPMPATVAPPPPYSTPPPDQPAYGYCDFLYHVGFMQGYFSDIKVNFPIQQTSYALHSIVLARSPFFYRRLLSSGGAEDGMGRLEIEVHGSHEALHTALGHLYRPLAQQDLCYIVSERPQVAAELLQLSDELELDLLQHQILLISTQNLNQHSVYFWISVLVAQTARKPWMDVLDYHIIQFLTSILPGQLDAFPTHSEEHEQIISLGSTTAATVAAKNPGVMDLVHIYAGLPTSYLKRCLEHKDLCVTNVLQRYVFATQVLRAREQMGQRDLSVAMQFQSKGDADILLVKRPSRMFGRWKPKDDDEP
ncbi:hypothetical protein BX666DRAFT_1996862 [Dichotomocladium elegans]|nr:hypothetical protein BX666DRAFT_1996862 [Dichotomocladium elegans]